MNYENNVKELEKIVEKLSSEKIGLEEGLKLYEQGIKLAQESLKELSSVKGKIEVLNKQLEELEAFDEVEEDEDDE